jgi:hypothetical protein
VQARRLCLHLFYIAFFFFAHLFIIAAYIGWEMCRGSCFWLWSSKNKLLQVHWYGNVPARQLFLALVGFVIVSVNAGFIFFASIHCPSVMLKCEGPLGDINYNIQNPNRKCQLEPNPDCSTRGKWASWSPSEAW